MIKLIKPIVISLLLLGILLFIQGKINYEIDENGSIFYKFSLVTVSFAIFIIIIAIISKQNKRWFLEK